MNKLTLRRNFEFNGNREAAINKIKTLGLVEGEICLIKFQDTVDGNSKNRYLIAIGTEDSTNPTFFDNQLEAGDNVTIENGVISAESYNTITKSELDTGTSTTNRVVTAKVLSDWLSGKNYSTSDTKYTAGSGLTLSGTQFSLPITVSGSGDYVQSVTQTTNGLTVVLGTPTNTTYSTGSLAELNTGSNTTGKLQTAKNISDFVTGKINAIPKDTFLKAASYNPTTNILTLTVGNSTQNLETVTVDLKDLIDEYEAGNGLVLNGNVFSVDKSLYYTKTEVNTQLNNKQNKLIAGDNITIDSNNRISAESYAPGESYPTITVSELNGGSITETRVVTPKILSDWLNGKGYVSTDTTYSEITEAEINTGTASTLRTITGRRMKFALDKKVDNSRVLTDVPANAKFTDTTYTTGTLAQLNAGTDTTGRLYTAKILNDWVNTKGYKTTDTTYTAGNGLTLSGGAFSLPVTVSGTGSYVQSVTQTANGLTVTLGTPPNTNTTYTGSSSITLTSGSFRRAALTGDVTAGANSNSTTISNQAVTYSKMQNIPTGTVLGRIDSETGSPTAVTLANLKTALNITYNDIGGTAPGGYTLPKATSTTLGGVKLFNNTTQTVAANTVSTRSGRTYGIQTNSNGQLVVNVPWTDTTGGGSISWEDITDKPTTFTPSSHTHSASDITSGTLAIARIPTGTTSSTVALGNHSHAWSTITGKPTSFTPSSHSHSVGDISGVTGRRLIGRYSTTSGSAQEISIGSGLSLSTGGVLSATASSVSWGDITGKPTTFSPSTHYHGATDIQSVTGQRLIGRYSTTSGWSQEISIGTGLNLSTSGVLSATGSSVSWGDITGKPSTFSPASHNHTFYIGTTSMTTSRASGTQNIAGIGILNAQTIVATGEITAHSSSDERLKDNIKPIEKPFDVIDKLKPVSHTWNEKMFELNSAKTKGEDYGLIAQEVQEVLPEIVHPIYDEYLGVDYVKLVPFLIASVQELKSEINDLKEIIKDLKK